MTPVDLRSDTVTTPTPEMRDAMRHAEVGNAAWGEDPTVNALERRSAELLGKEAGLFVPSGTMGNQASLRVWASRRVAPEVICHARSHIYLNEAAGLATVCGAQARPVAGAGGRMPLDALEAAIQPADVSLKPQTAVIALENTHNYESGAVLPLDYLREVRALADAHGLPVHLDGARVFNAAAALGRPVAEVAGPVDSVQFCFSKGLGCPVGSMVVGSEAFIEEARRVRQYLGGAMRQAGVVAAPALLALDTMVKRLPEDHQNAKRLAGALKGLPLAYREPETNILIMDTAESGLTAPQVADACAGRGVLFSVVSGTELRAVTHHQVTREGVDRAAEALRAALAGGA